MSHVAGEKPNIKPYIVVFVSLMVLTVITVAVSYLDLSTPAAIAAALLIATVKGSLVACYFMHLISEKKLIYAVMGLSAILFLSVLVGPQITETDEVAIEEMPEMEAPYPETREAAHGDTGTAH